LTVLDYGVDDWSAFAAMQGGDFGHIARRMADVIARYEPRVVAPQVQIERVPTEPQRLRIRITGHLAGDASQAPILFIDTVLGDVS
jgi:type VI secretion system lysozyme-related protein